MAIIVQLRVMGNNVMKKDLVDLSIKSQVDSLAKTLINDQDVSV